MEHIRDFNSMKVKDYLDTGRYRRVLIVFHHGLGDAVMFYATCLRTLKSLYPGIEFFYSTHLGQEEIFGKVDECADYDIAFHIEYPCSEWGMIEETKSEKCARVELGIKIETEDYSIENEFGGNLVGVHFNSTSCPRMDVPYEFAKKLWNQIEREGFIPIDTHMRHKNDNSHSVIHDFEKCRRIDNVTANMRNLFGILKSCCGFAGVPSGNMPCALTIFPPEKIMYISSEFKANRLTRLNVNEINVRKPYDSGVIHEWLEKLRG